VIDLLEDLDSGGVISDTGVTPGQDGEIGCSRVLSEVVGEDGLPMLAINDATLEGTGVICVFYDTEGSLDLGWIRYGGAECGNVGIIKNAIAFPDRKSGDPPGGDGVEAALAIGEGEEMCRCD
jgi:hypothetical protein